MPITRRRTLSAIVASAAALGLAGRVKAQAGLDGDYRGVLDLGAAKLRLRLVVVGDSVTLYSLDQGNAAIPASKVERRGDWLFVDFAAIGARFEAEHADGRLTGTFVQGRAFPLTLVRGAIPADPAGLDTLLSEPMSAALLSQIRTRLGTPGMAVGWQRGTAAAAQLSDGLRAAGHPEPVRDGDLWHIGSITKSFTATLFARAVTAGVIGWSTRLGERLKAVPAAWRDLTAVELLSHHAGLPTDIPLPELLALPRIEPDPRASRRRYVSLALAQTPVAPPRSKFSYSNCGYVLAAAMLEEATGLSWEALIRREVLAPLKLDSAGFGPPGSAAKIDQPRGHDHGQPLYLDNPAAMAPAGGLHLSLADLLRYLGAHRDCPDLLPKTAWAELHRPRFGSPYAFGWFAGTDGRLWHNGSNTLFYAEAAVEPATGLVMASCSNDTALIARQQVLLPALRRAAGVAG